MDSTDQMLTRFPSLDFAEWNYVDEALPWTADRMLEEEQDTAVPAIVKK